jgi:hypothetical protein
MGVQPIDLGPYIEGLNLVDPLPNLSDKELSLCRNIRIGNRGDIYKRPGHDYVGTDTLSNKKINGDNLVNLAVRWYKADGTRKLISAAGGKLKFRDDVTGAWTDISINGTTAVMSSSVICDWAVYKNRLYIADGTAIQRYNGTDDIYAGGVIPAAPTLAQTTGGSLTLLKTYKYFVTSIAGDMGEGPKGAEATITLSGANNKVNLSNILAAAAKFEETEKRIYRTKGDGTIFYLLTTIPSATTTYSDIIADTGLGLEYVPAIVPPATARFIIIGNDERAYYFGMPGVDASLVRVSDVGFPDRVIDNGKDGFFVVSNNDNDILTGGGSVPGGIVFFKRNTVWLSRGFGYPPISIAPRDKRGGGIGSTSPFSIVSTPLGLMFLSQRGELYNFDGTNMEEVGRKISTEFKGMNEAAMGRIVACYHDFRYQISYDYRGSKGYNWKTLEFDVINKKWEGPHENGDFYNPSYYSVWDSVKDKGELYFGEGKATNGSYVYGRTEFTDTDRGNKYLGLMRSGRLILSGLGDVVTTRAFAHAEFSSDCTLTFTHIDDSNKRTSVDLNTPIFGDGSILGVGLLGTFILSGAKSSVLSGPLGINARARAPMYEISDGKTGIRMRINKLRIKARGLPIK